MAYMETEINRLLNMVRSATGGAINPPTYVAPTPEQYTAYQVRKQDPFAWVNSAKYAWDYYTQGAAETVQNVVKAVDKEKGESEDKLYANLIRLAVSAILTLGIVWFLLKTFKVIR